MSDARHLFEACCLAAALVGFALTMTWLFFQWTSGLVREEFRRLYVSAGVLGCLLFGSWAGVAVRSMLKPKDDLRVIYANGVISGAERNRGTNSTAVINWRIDPSFRPFPIPATTLVYVDYRVLNSTNEWEALEAGGVSAGNLQWIGEIPGGGLATNYEYYVYSGYVPPQPIHTNGEWRASGMWYDGLEGRRAMPLHMRFKGDGRTFYPRELDSTGGNR